MDVQITGDADHIHLHRHKYIVDLLIRCGIESSKPSKTPMSVGSSLSKYDGHLLANVTEFRSLVGDLQYRVFTRPNIAYLVNKLCYFLHAPDSHWVALKRVLKYLKATLYYGLLLQKSDTLDLIGFSNSDWCRLYIFWN